MAATTQDPAAEVPRPLAPAPDGPDRVFHVIAAAGASVALILTGFIAVYLLLESLPAFREAGWSFFTTRGWAPQNDPPVFGIASMLFGTAVVAAVALVIAVPVSVGAAVFINEYAPRRAQQLLTSMVDLMAAVPSIIFAIWGVYFLLPRLFGIEGWMANWLSFIPFFRIDEGASLGRSLFNAGLVVSLMVLPITTSLMREVLAQVPRGECEAALALGGTRWGMVRMVVLPFGRGGLVGAAMLGLGRALGETIVVALILALSFEISPQILEAGGATVASVIAISFGEATERGLEALMAAGLTLFVLTLLVNLAAATIVNRSRSGAGTDL